MKNTLNDLTNYLFEQIEIINDDELNGKELDEKLKKANLINDISKSIIQAGNLQLNAIKFKDKAIGNQEFNNTLLGNSNAK